jgi:hypothetical protein
MLTALKCGSMMSNLVSRPAPVVVNELLVAMEFFWGGRPPRQCADASLYDD